VTRTAAALLAGLYSLILTASQGSDLPPPSAVPPSPDPIPAPDRRSDSAESLRARQAQLKRQLALLAPEGHYVVVDTARNMLRVKRRDDVVLEAIASTGSGTILDDPGKPGIRWVFDTPRGEFKIQSKLTNPVWVKPDWAFLEEGLGVPTDPAQRLEPGTLGDYALGFGKGYFIHGTLYRRLLGKNVTHGCIRLSDDDLRTVYRLTRIGTPVMIF
jgi:L,D-transpeptidase ErfK/SrfK